MNIEELDILKELSEQTYFGDLPFLYYADLIGKLLTAYEKEKEKNKELRNQLNTIKDIYYNTNDLEELRKDGKHYKCKLGKIKYSFRNIHKWED